MADTQPDPQTQSAPADASAALSAWADAAFDTPKHAPAQPRIQLELRQQDHAALGWGVSCIGTPLRLAERAFEHGLGTHASSEIVVQPPPEATEFRAVVGIDNNHDTQAARGSAVFTVMLDGAVVFESPVLRGDSAPLPVSVAVPEGTRQVVLKTATTADGPGWDHTDWADAHFVLTDGTRLYLDENRAGRMPLPTQPPFSFRFGSESSAALLPRWSQSRETEQAATFATREYVWTDADTGLRVAATVRIFNRYPALDWVLWFENTGTADTPIIADVRALDLILQCPLVQQQEPYRLHRTLGAPSNPRDFEPRTVTVARDAPQRLSAGGGRSSNADFPFFTVETGQGVWIVAVGWSGQWEATLQCPDALSLHVNAGQQYTHFRLRPGERVRAPRILLFHGSADVAESHAQFRQLIYTEYAARRGQAAPEPVLFCNTCFTRGGGWLHECNAANQISLINAYAPFGLEALITDAGWFEGGWPAGAGNWTPRKEAYPHGMAPVAAAARAHSMLYGLWFEPERVMAGSTLHREHPEWLLRADGDQRTYLANFALPEVQEYFFQIVKGFMDLPGFGVYRQDFNMDPLPYWQHSDPVDRQGISEAKYIAGLYAFWDRIARTWPKSLREECASGGRRIDLETIMRMHLHQRSDYWFDNEAEQAALWSLSRYVPNNVITTPLNRLDEYSFHSVLASSLCLGWIADAPDFDVETARRLTDTYRRVRHLLVGAWYPLLPYSRDATLWMAAQYHRPDLGAGLLIALRRPNSPYCAVDLRCRGLEADADYEVRSSRQDGVQVVRGRALLEGWRVTIPVAPGSELIIYRRLR